MKTLIHFAYQLVLILLLLNLALQQNIASNIFASDQIILWNGNNVVQYPSATTSYQFSANFQNPPTAIQKIFAVFNGFNFINQNRISFFVTAILNPSLNGSYSISFTPLNSLIFYSAAFTIIATTSASSNFLYLDRYYLTPSIINSTSRTPGTNQETFTLVTGFILTDANFEIRIFLSFFDSFQSNGTAGVTASPAGTFIPGSTQFDVTTTVEAGSELYQCSIIAIIINKKTFLIHHSSFSINAIQIRQNYSTFADITLASQTSTNFSIPSFYGPTMSRNCTIGFYGVSANVDTSAKSIMFDYASSSGSMSVISAVSGGGVMGKFQALCIIDCVSDGFYSSALQKCDYCQNYIKNCEACINSTYCTDCGVNTFFDTIHRKCSCNSGTRVIGGCTMITGCLSIDDHGLCLQCQSSFTLSSDMKQCFCPSGLHLAGKTCTNITGCITAALVKGQSTCFACNTTLHFKTDGKGTCGCGAGYTFNNGVCTTLCGNGELFGFEQCDDGNHVQGDGCSSMCQIETSYVCNTSSAQSQSICSYNAQFAQINFVQSFRDYAENAGYFIFTVTPAISNLNKMDFASAISITCASNISAPIVDYSNGNLQIKIYFLENIENKMMNITLKFNQTIVIHKPISSVFDIKSLNSPMTVFTKFPQYNFITLYLQILSLVAVVIFLLGSLSHKMIGVETIHVFQFIFFTSIYEITYSDLFISSIRSLRFTANYPDIFYNEMVGLKEGDIFQSLKFAFTFVGNYYIIGTIMLMVIFIFIASYFIKLYRNSQFIQTENERTKINKQYQIRKETIYSTAFFPIIVGYYLQCFFAVEAQLYRKNEERSKLTIMTNSLLSILFIWLASFTIFREIFFNIKYNLKSLFYNVENRYIAVYLVNILLNIIFFNFSDRFQYDLTSMASYNFIYFLVILAYRPYRHHLHNFHILYNQAIYILWIILLIYQDRSQIKLSDYQKYIILTSLISALSLSLVVSAIRILLEITEHGFQVEKIRKYYKNQDEIANNFKRKSAQRIKKILRRDIEGLSKYWIQDQHRQAIENNRELINAQRNALGLPNLFPSPKIFKQTAKPLEMMRRQTTMNEQIEDNFEVSHESSEHKRWRKQVEIEDLKMKLRQNLLKYKQKKKQNERQQQMEVRRNF